MKDTTHISPHKLLREQLPNGGWKVWCGQDPGDNGWIVNKEGIVIDVFGNGSKEHIYSPKHVGWTIEQVTYNAWSTEFPPRKSKIKN